MIAKRVMAALAASALLYSCSTTRVSDLTASDVPPERIYQNSFVSTDEDPARLVFIRDKGLTGSACKVNLYVNGRRAFSMGTAEKTIVEVDPGDYVLRLEFGVSTFCPDEYQTKEINLKPGEERRYRFSMSGNFNIGFTREL